MFRCSHISASGTCTFVCIDIGGEGCTHQRITQTFRSSHQADMPRRTRTGKGIHKNEARGARGARRARRTRRAAARAAAAAAPCTACAGAHRAHTCAIAWPRDNPHDTNTNRTAAAAVMTPRRANTRAAPRTRMEPGLARGGATTCARAPPPSLLPPPAPEVVVFSQLHNFCEKQSYESDYDVDSDDPSEDVDKLCGERVHDGSPQYQVLWANGDETWECAHELFHSAPGAVIDFLRSLVNMRRRMNSPLQKSKARRASERGVRACERASRREGASPLS